MQRGLYLTSGRKKKTQKKHGVTACTRGCWPKACHPHGNRARGGIASGGQLVAVRKQWREVRWWCVDSVRYVRWWMWRWMWMDDACETVLYGVAVVIMRRRRDMRSYSIVVTYRKRQSPAEATEEKRKTKKLTLDVGGCSRGARRYAVAVTVATAVRVCVRRHASRGRLCRRDARRINDSRGDIVSLRSR
ncbi:hypothetical protein CC85DRAFT_109529 [Cutaneotrichosporon oleaginosum]|uniref:Uncharacterized protein n=1 Tax=Cutaneotrichosporon oleaginosum TaxID=879819 RepID=A0A0J0XKN8_9TREE|nr:uncharacterized protein CC85DRAFT_109529 [Cutaneotrichosporon oleaginosum]KLT41627.1 hypothetical protein CC85DRAFT_109529 [Cutaneotrichosporon oleaginosum]